MPKMPARRHFLTRIHPSPGLTRRLGLFTVIGRAEGDADLVVDDSRASRRQCVLEVTPTGVARVADLDSDHGTYLDGQRITRSALSDGSILRTGDTVFAYTCADSASADDTTLSEALSSLGRSLRLAAAELAAARAGKWLREAGAPVLVIVGPTGSDRAALARRAHEASGRSGPCVTLDCGAPPPEDLEGLLFGAEQGAVRAARGGTLFIDTLSELPLALQRRLFEPAEDHTAQTLLRTDVDREAAALVCGVDRSLPALLAEGAVRAELSVRARVLEPALAPLRHRREDILPGFLAHLGIVCSRTTEAVEALLVYDWPNNDLELRATALQVRPFAEATGTVELSMLPAKVQRSLRAPATAPLAEQNMDAESLARRLREHKGDVTSLARAIGLSRRRVLRMMQAFGVTADDRR